MEILRMEHLSKAFTLHQQNRRIQSIYDVSLSVGMGQFVGITGLSGAGKSTILKCINRTYTTTSGCIYFESPTFGRVDLARVEDRKMLYIREREIGYVSQFLNVMPRTTAKEHVMNSLLAIGADANQARVRAEEILDYFKLPENLWDLYPQTFSGGERLRLNLAHTMVKQMRLLLLDEPTASLDNKTKLLVRDILLQLKDSTAMVGIFHDLEFMDGVCDRVVRLENGRLLEAPAQIAG